VTKSVADKVAPLSFSNHCFTKLAAILGQSFLALTKEAMLVLSCTKSDTCHLAAMAAGSNRREKQKRCEIPWHNVSSNIICLLLFETSMSLLRLNMFFSQYF
jgi:hypothetical protein